jgi:hypothetical protein
MDPLQTRLARLREFIAEDHRNDPELGKESDDQRRNEVMQEAVASLDLIDHAVVEDSIIPRHARRGDAGWGDAKTARRGNEDSTHVPTTPQMQAFNAPIRLALEDYAGRRCAEVLEPIRLIS